MAANLKIKKIVKN